MLKPPNASPETLRRLARHYALLAAAVLVGAAVAQYLLMTQSREIALAKRIFRGLVQGEASVAELIDWDRLYVLGVDLGALHRAKPDPQEREKFRAAWLGGFLGGARLSGTNWDRLRSWRVLKRLDDRTIVSASVADTDHLLLLALSIKYPRRLLELAYWIPGAPPSWTVGAQEQPCCGADAQAPL